MTHNKANTFVTTIAAGVAALSSVFTPAALANDNIEPVSITAPTEQTLSVKEAYARSEGQIVFIDAGNLLRSEVEAVDIILSDYQTKTATAYEVIKVDPSETNNSSLLCFNAKSCYPVNQQNLTTALSSIGVAAELNGLESNSNIAQLDLN